MTVTRGPKDTPLSNDTSTIRRSYARGRGVVPRIRGVALRCAAPLVAVTAALLPGCAHYEARPFQIKQSAAARPQQRNESGLYVAVEDLTGDVESGEYFDRDLVEQGFAPVLVLLELERDSEGTFELRREDLVLCLRDGTRLTPAEPTDVAADVRYSHFRSFVGFLFLVPGFFVASSVSNANTELTADYERKALESIRVNRNSPVFTGVVFFHIPKEFRASFSMTDAFVEARLRRSGGQDDVGDVIEFPVHFSR